MRVRPASASEIEARSRLTFAVWGNGITLAQYLERERALAETAFARRGLRTWLLEDDRGGVLASCETYRMASALDGVRGEAHGFASVFVEPRLRGRGHASALIRAVLDVLRSEGAQAAHLFSEVGTSLYGALGFRARPIHARRFRPAPGPVEAVARTFSRADAESVLAPRFSLAPAGRFRILLDHAQLEWHRTRAAAYHRFRVPDRLSPDALAGAVAGGGWIAWFADYRLERLLTLAVAPGRPEESAALVEATRRAAAALGLPLAEHWEAPATPLPGGEVVALDDEIPMLCPFAEGLLPGAWTDYGRGCWI